MNLRLHFRKLKKYHCLLGLRPLLVQYGVIILYLPWEMEASTVNPLQSILSFLFGTPTCIQSHCQATRFPNVLSHVSDLTAYDFQ